MNIGIVIGADEGHYARRDVACEMAGRWAKKHGATVYAKEMKNMGGGVQFCKFHLLNEVMPDHDFVMWLDSDCCVIDDDFDLETALQRWGNPATRMWYAMDWNGLCGCTLIFKRCDWSRRLLDACNLFGAARDSFGQFEQGTLKLILAWFPFVQWYTCGLPICVVSDQTVKPWPMPFVWHLSMAKDAVCYMNDVNLAVKEGRFENYAKSWPGMKHAVRYE